MTLVNDQIAGAVITFNRKDYLMQTLDSLYQANGSEEIDWYAFIDGSYVPQTDTQLDVEVNQSEMKQAVEGHNLDFQKIITQPHNKDIVGQKDDACRLFDGYSYCMFFEDDLVVGKDYLTNLHRAKKQFPGWFVSMYWEENQGELNELHDFETARCWGYELSSDEFFKMKDDWDRYVELMKETSYRNRVGNPHREEIEGMIEANSLSHDVFKSNLCYKHLKGKLKPAVTRGKYVGRSGSHAYNLEHFWKKQNMHLQPDKIEYNEDPIKQGEFSIK